MKILAALHAVLSALSAEGIGKNRNNQQQNYKFRGIDDIYNSISGLFAQHKILPLPRYISVVQTERESGSGKAIFVTRLEGYFKLKSLEDGSEVEIGPFPGEAMDSADKSTNKAMSASFKYALLQTFVIPTEGDNDADGTTLDVKGRGRESQEERPTRQVETGPVEIGRLSGQAPAQPNGPKESAPQKRGPSDGHPLMIQIEAKLKLYGAKRADYEQKVAESFGVASIYNIPPGQLPQALLKVVEQQAAAKRSPQDKARGKPAGKPAGKAAGKPAKQKQPLAPPDDDSGLDQQVDDSGGPDDGIPV